MTPPPGYREQDACANCVHSDMGWDGDWWCELVSRNAPVAVSPNGICDEHPALKRDAHERREAERG